MSEPVTNAQIEDVLSSIRRLVSEENRPDSRPKQTGPGAGSDRLVLTPSLRVADQPEEAEEPEAAQEPVADAAAGNPEGTGAVDTGEAAAAPEGAPWRMPDATLYHAAGYAEQPSQDEDTAPEQGSADQAAQDPGQAGDGDGGGSMNRAISAVLGSIHRDAEPAGDASDGPQDEAPAEPETAVEQGQVSPEPAAGMTAASRAESLSAKIEALEAAIGQTRDQWEPDGDVGDDYAGTSIETIAWEDRAETPPAPEMRAEDDAPAEAAPPASADSPATDDAEADIAEDFSLVREPAGRARGRARARMAEMTAGSAAGAAFDAAEDDDEATDLLASDETVLDEDTLREMVADIVRQELQGALGERITRNVRKLVRREIHRALSAQNLD